MTTKIESASTLRAPLSSVVGRRGVLVRGRLIPTWVFLLAAFAASRVVATVVLFVGYALASSQGWSISHFDGHPGFLGFLSSWDGQYYKQIATTGYPSSLPVNGAGHVQQNPWAFMPVYPMIVRAIMGATTLGFPVAGLLVAVAFGAGATFALHRVLQQQFGSRTALWGALFFCFGPMSFILEVTYADSVFLFFLFCGLAAMMARRYLVMIPFALVASFSHPGALVLAAALGVQCLVRLIRREPFPHRERAMATFAIIVVVAASFAWPVIAGFSTGDPSAYFDTELAWWSVYVGYTQFLPFSPSFIMAGHFWGAGGIVLVIVVFAALAWWLLWRSNRVLGVDILAYTGSYLAYLAAVFLPQQSFFRMLLPLSPLLGHPALSRTRLRARITLAASVALQPLAVVLLWIVWPP